MSNKYFISGGTLDDGSKKDLFISDGKISGFENSLEYIKAEINSITKTTTNMYTFALPAAITI